MTAHSEPSFLSIVQIIVLDKTIFSSIKIDRNAVINKLFGTLNAYFTLTDWLFHSGGLPVRFNGLKFIPCNISAGTAVPTAASLL